MLFTQLSKRFQLCFVMRNEEWEKSEIICNEKLGISSDELGALNLLCDCSFDNFKQNKMKPLSSVLRKPSHLPGYTHSFKRIEWCVPLLTFVNFVHVWDSTRFYTFRSKWSVFIVLENKIIFILSTTDYLFYLCYLSLCSENSRIKSSKK